MSKVTIIDNYRVVVGVDESYVFGTNERQKQKCKLSRAQNIESKIKRHVDGFDSVAIEYDITELCSFCGNNWETNQDPDDKEWKMNMPMCCDEAVEEFEQEESCKAKTSQ